MVYVAILGHGVVGSGVAEVLRKNADSIAHKAGEPIEIRRILDLREFPDLPYADKFTKEFDDILHDPDIRIVVETMGGLHPAYDFVKSCLLAGKNVVTSNKELVAAKGDELLEIAKNNNLNFLFEASVGGGIPILRPIDQCLAANEVYEIAGILNGTTNFMLTRMIEDHMSFEDALALAQKLGYAERNPEADVEGYDTCRKISILTALASEREVNYEEVYTEGITAITDTDFKYAEKMKTAIKLFGTSILDGGRASVAVCPVMIDASHPLYSVNDVFNAVMVKGNMVGTVMFYGSGAGKLPTASAVVADIMEIAVNTDRNIPIGWTEEKLTVTPMEERTCRYFIRFAGDAGERRQEIEASFGPVEIISIDGMDEFAVLTGPMKEGKYAKISAAFDGIRQRIRAELAR